MMLEIKNLHAKRDESEILKGLDLIIQPGEIHAIMGPNGAGKSTLAKILAGDPAYEVTEGIVRFKGEDLLELEPEVRAQNGLFMSFQYPPEIPGVNNLTFLHLAYNAQRKARQEEEMPLKEFELLLDRKMKEMDIPIHFKQRNLNEGFSGGEKKRNEILQMAIFRPKLAILDETDSGLDIDALRTVAEGVNQEMHSEMGLLLITHYQRLLDYIRPHYVHVLINGRIVRSGGPELALELEERGYDWLEESLQGEAHS